MSEIIVLSGIPCSGKSSFKKSLEEILPYITISRDDIRENSFAPPYKFNRHNEDIVSDIFSRYFKQAVDYDMDIILDNTHCKEKYLKQIIENCPKNYQVKIRFFNIPLWKAYVRNVGRWMKTGKFIPFKVIKDMKKSFDKIDQADYWQYKFKYFTNV